ncbi:lysine-rich nucleolar protein 1 [Pseudonaja textilis]|uniref:lysine-rich nucleolar protein 1 n=1 Tax=Pseudonaja textilis TaxID=8673 RepID=UPI000EAA5F79|nr:lysine-rich nucleolar protein 1 [Pseudonaja textilis]
MKNSEQTARKRNKAEDPNCGQVIIIESPKRHCSGLGKKAKPPKLKCLVKETNSDLPDPKKKQSDSESKKEARASSPVVIESSSDLELRDTKKRNKVLKKKKDRKLFCIQIQNSDGLDEGQPGTDFHVSKKGEKAVLEVGRQDEESVMKRKKKKKEKRKDKPACLELLHSGDSEEDVKQISAELKPGCQEMPSGQKKSRTLEQKVVGDEVEKKYFEYYKKYLENISKKDIASYKCEDAQSRDGPMQRRNDLARRSEEDSEAIQKKKKKKKKLNKISPASLSCLAKIQENHCNMMSEYSLKCGSEKSAGLGKANKAAKKKAKRQTGDASRFSEAGQDISSKVGAPGGKRKKAKKHKVKRDDQDGFEGSQERQVKKKRKNKEIENSWDGGKKAKMKPETKVTADEIKLVAFRKGNCDEVNIDKVRRQELQEEIDRESGKTKIAKDGSDHCLGQWSTATFESLEQKTKFHRLMGGLKKGFVPTQSSAPANANKPNLALDRPREQELQHNLEAEFKKAMEFKHHRGIGLGFQSSAPSGAHIDKYASRSIKFEV